MSCSKKPRKKQECSCQHTGVGLVRSLTSLELARLPGCWHLSAEHSSLLNRVEGTPKTRAFLSNCLLGGAGTLSATGRLAWKPVQGRQHPQPKSRAPLQPHPSCLLLSPRPCDETGRPACCSQLPTGLQAAPRAKGLQRPQAEPSCHLLYFKPSELPT